MKPEIEKRQEIEGYALLEELALDFSWSWNRNHDTVKIWRQIDTELWEMLHNPWSILQAVSTDKLKKLWADPNFRKEVNELLQVNRVESTQPAWFQNRHSACPLTTVAYFSMEFMLGESLPIYSGGLGNVAGDQLKGASDLGVPVIGIGLLYQQGYFRQVIDKNGVQKAFYPYNSPEQLPISPLRTKDGEWLRLQIDFPGYPLYFHAWEVKVGRSRLFLLDSNDPTNYPPNRGITSELYGGDSELRLKQEILLGIGGWRLLEALGIKPEVCHLNEGHAAFAVLDRASSYMMQTGQSFESALAITRAGNLFTTHTAVTAGFDRFAPSLIELYLGKYAQRKLDISVQDLLSLGRMNPKDTAEPFNMAYLAIRGSGAVNGVSRLHGEVSRDIFSTLFPRWPTQEVPVGYVTNGVHMPSWNSVSAGNLWEKYGGKSCWVTEPQEEECIKQIPASEIWQMRNDSRQHLVSYVRRVSSMQLSANGSPREFIERTKHMFDPNALTLGFARRFATYKRPNLLLHDRQRLLRILTNKNRPVQLILAGKAHPADKPGQALIQEWYDFIWNSEARYHAIFISDYDMYLTKRLVHGVDVWINTPRRPWEACGTSGMKVLVNGGLNLSELDGWWAEAYTPDVGWAIGDMQEHGSSAEWDAAEANDLYSILENQVIPEFYERNGEGIPIAWVEHIRTSMARLTPRYSADRCVRQYTEQHYIPAAKLYFERDADKGLIGKKIAQWQRDLRMNWGFLRFGDVKVEKSGDQHRFKVQVYLGQIDPQAVKVELFRAGTNDAPFIKVLSLVRELPGSPKMFIYEGSVPASSPAEDYTARVIPYFPGANVPLEASQILWQK